MWNDDRPRAIRDVRNVHELEQFFHAWIRVANQEHGYAEVIVLEAELFQDASENLAIEGNALEDVVGL